MRLAIFAGREVLIGTFMRELYCYGLTSDGLWARLEPMSGDNYQTRLANGKEIESRLVYQKES